VWFVAVLAPTSSVIPVRDAMAEHRLYLASAGLLMAAASLSWRTIATRRSVRLALAGVLFVLAAATYRRHDLWSRPLDLWEEAVRRAPAAWQAHWGYAEALREVGQCDRARPEYETALRLYPEHAGARAGLEICRSPR
jgi:Tfp pilus assembly protein PilF